jgi:ribosome-associated protein YbcJ (S4-like RNA binding protein)
MSKIDGTDYAALRDELLKELEAAPPGSQQRATVLDSLVMVKAEMDKQRPPKALDLENLFSHHVPFGNQANRYSGVRQTLHNACVACCSMTPASAEQTLAIRAMHVAMMHFNSAIACNEKPA